VRKILNVGGSSKAIALPPEYQGWMHVLLDIDPRNGPDIVCDARNLKSLPAAGYDAVYCSHNLEHYYRHDVFTVLAGFRHVLTDDGFVDIRVPDMGALIRTVVERKLDIDDFLYSSPAGPVTVRDVIYGFAPEIEESGNDFFAHKTGFTEKSLVSTLKAAGFGSAYAGSGNLEIRALAFKHKPSRYAMELLRLPPVSGSS
jgi:hypothetical protein